MALKRGRPKAKPKPPEEKCYCRRCRKTISGANFYQATNELLDTNGKFSICLDCCKDIYTGFFKTHKIIDTALFYTCQELDVRYEPEAVESTKSHINTLKEAGSPHDSVFGYYKSKLSSFGRTNGYEAFQFRDSTVLTQGSSSTINKYDPDEYQSVEVSYLRARWGDMKVEELQWLEQKWEEWSQGFEIDSKNRVLIIEQIVFEEFYIFKERAEGKDVSKRLKNIKDLMGMGNLQPKQENASESAEFSSFPAMIAHIEKEKPCYKENSILKDVDNMQRKIESLVGTLARTLGIQSGHTQTFEEEFKDYTLDLSNLESGGDK